MMVMFVNGGTESLFKIDEKKLKITVGENMNIVKNVTGSGNYPEPQTLGFKDDDGITHFLKSGETIECNYKRSMSHRLVIEKEKAESKKKKEVI